MQALLALHATALPLLGGVEPLAKRMHGGCHLFLLLMRAWRSWLSAGRPCAPSTPAFTPHTQNCSPQNRRPLTYDLTYIHDVTNVQANSLRTRLGAHVWRA